MARMTANSPASPRPASWTSQEIILHHGTIRHWAPSILKAVDVKAGRTSVDFGQGCYTTTVPTQARSWAGEMARKTKLKGPAASPVVIEFTVPREDLAGLEAIWFVRGTTDADDYWSFVTHCRSGGADHSRAHAASQSRVGWYDLAIGPVAASWRQRLSLLDCDQVSFHSQKAANLLDVSAKVVV